MRSKKALYNITIKFVYQIIALICGLITPRLLLGAFGSSYNGIVSSITQFLNICSIFTLGIAGAFRTELYKGFAKDDIESISKAVKAAEKCFHKAGYAMVVYTVALTFIYPFILQNQIPKKESMLLVLILFISVFGEYYYGQTSYYLLQADQSEYISTLCSMIVIILNTLVAALLIKINCSIFVVKFGSSLLYLIKPFLLNRYVKRRYRIIKNCKAETALLSQRKAAMTHSIANIIHDKTDIVLLTLFSDVKLISVYTVYYSVVTNVKQVMQNFTSGLEGAFGSMWARNEKELFKKNFSTYEFLMYSFSSVVFTCVGILLVPFIKIYTSGIMDVNYILPTFSLLVTITEGIFCIRQPYVTIVQAAGKYKETKDGAIAEAVINLVTSITFLNILGINGVIIGTMVANIFRTVQYAVFGSKELLDRSIWVVIKRVMWHILNSCSTVLLYNIIMRSFKIENWGSWLICGCMAFFMALLITTVSAWIIYRNDFKNALNFTKRMFSNRKRK